MEPETITVTLTLKSYAASSLENLLKRRTAEGLPLGMFLTLDKGMTLVPITVNKVDTIR